MKKIILLLAIVFSVSTIYAQNSDIPNITLKDLNGKDYKISEKNSDNLIVITFWATWCGPCLKEMAALSDVYDDWKEETGVEIIAVSVDDSRTVKRVRPLINGKSWDFTFLLDENQDLKRKMNVANPPHLFLINKGKIVYQHSGYTPGAEDKLYEEIKKYAN